MLSKHLKFKTHHNLALFCLSSLIVPFPSTNRILISRWFKRHLPPSVYSLEAHFPNSFAPVTKSGPSEKEQKWCGSLSSHIFKKKAGCSPLPPFGELEQRRSIGEPQYKSNREKVPGFLDGLYFPWTPWLSLVMCERKIFDLTVFWGFIVHKGLAYTPKIPSISPY